MVSFTCNSTGMAVTCCSIYASDFSDDKSKTTTDSCLMGKTLGIFSIMKINDAYLSELIVRKHLYSHSFNIKKEKNWNVTPLHRRKVEDIHITMKVQQENCCCARTRAGNCRPAGISRKVHPGKVKHPAPSPALQMCDLEEMSLPLWVSVSTSVEGVPFQL